MDQVACRSSTGNAPASAWNFTAATGSSAPAVPASTGSVATASANAIVRFTVCPPLVSNSVIVLFQAPDGLGRAAWGELLKAVCAVRLPWVVARR
ncbi:hypothetical protein GCM10027184_43080 [Saccharothrix stipae]